MKNKIFFSFITSLLMVILIGCGNKSNKLEFTTLEHNDSIFEKEYNMTYTYHSKIMLPKVASSDSNCIKNLRDNIVIQVLGEKYVDLRDSKLLNVYNDSSFNEYKQFMEENKVEYAAIESAEGEENMKFMMNFETWIEGNVLFESAKDSILCYKSLLYSYTGGAHGMSTSNHQIYDLRDGMPLDKEMIFKPAYENEVLNLLITHSGIKQQENDENYELEDIREPILFGADNIYITNNISISPEGLIFHYNPYEVAPYSEGIIEISLPFVEIESILEPNTVVYNYLKSQDANKK